jgi:hypothetical protein
MQNEIDVSAQATRLSYRHLPGRYCWYRFRELFPPLASDPGQAPLPMWNGGSE